MASSFLAVLRRDVLEKLKWLGVKVSQDEIGGHVSRLTSQDSAIAGWVVETDEEGWCAELARQHLHI